VDLAYLTFSNSNRVLPYDLLSAKVGWQKQVNGRFFVDASVGGDNLFNETYYEYIFVGPTYAGLAQPPNGTGDGTIIPGPYDATFYGGAKITWTF
jgi:iron complex outermembrane receptor protein